MHTAWLPLAAVYASSKVSTCKPTATGTAQKTCRRRPDSLIFRGCDGYLFSTKYFGGPTVISVGAWHIGAGGEVVLAAAEASPTQTTQRGAGAQGRRERGPGRSAPRRRRVDVLLSGGGRREERAALVCGTKRGRPGVRPPSGHRRRPGGQVAFTGAGSDGGRAVREAEQGRPLTCFSISVVCCCRAAGWSHSNLHPRHGPCHPCFATIACSSATCSRRGCHLNPESTKKRRI